MTTVPWGLKRLSEKPLELKFASQLNHQCGGTLLWFGLTQKQEAECGFDIATRVGSALFMVQMKASSQGLKGSDARRFKVPDDQLQRLRGIKVASKGAFQGKRVLRVSGHRDCRRTGCESGCRGKHMDV